MNSTNPWVNFADVSPPLDEISTVAWILTAIIPIVSGIVGWGTNVVALKMTFYPLEFKGCLKPVFGWQGIVPMKAAKMAEKAVDLMTTRLISVQDVFRRLKPDEFVAHVRHVLRIQLDEILNKLAMELHADAWLALPHYIKEEIINNSMQLTPTVVEHILSDMTLHIEEVFDLKTMIVEAFVQDKDMLNQIFLQVGEKELSFIKRSGFYFGFLFGLLQATAWVFYKGWWVLPLAGFIVGYLTNYLALKMIFKPVNPRSCCGGRYVLHGLFLKRKNEVADHYARFTADNVLTSSRVLNFITTSSNPKLKSIVRDRVHESVDEYAGVGRIVLQSLAGVERYEQFKDRFADEVYAGLPAVMREGEEYADSMFNIANLMRERLQGLPYKDFEQLLHPVFEEDEWKLILVGAILGLAVGFLQVLVNELTA